MSEERNAIPLIITGICSILGTVAVLWYYGYLHFAKPEDALLLNEFTMLKTVPGEDYKVALEPAPQVAQCIDGVLVLFDTEQKGLTGVLVNNSAASGDLTVVAGTALQTVRLHRLKLSVADACIVSIKDGAGTTLDKFNFAGNGGGVVLDFGARPWYTTSAGNALIINVSAAVQVDGRAEYIKN